MPLLRGRRRVRVLTGTVESPLGPVRVQTDRWPNAVLLVDAPGLPAIRLVMPDSDVAALVVDGVRVPISHPGTWTLRRSSRRIRTTVAGRTYELRPTGGRRSRLFRDGTALADAHGGWAAYLPVHLAFPGKDARLTWRSGYDATDVAVGNALVIGYGAGSPGLLVNLAFGWLDLWS